MKKKIIILVSILAVAALIFGIGELGGLFPWQHLSEDKVYDNESQIEDIPADDTNSSYKPNVTDTKAVYDEDDVVNNIDITGTWMAEHDETNTDDYYVLHFDYDGSGNLTNMADWLGLPFAYETDGNNIMTHMGSADDDTPMTYDPDDNVIIYDDVRYTFVYEKVAELVGRWDSEVDANGEYTELIIEPDGSGYVMNMPSNTGVPIRFEVGDDGAITTEVGSPDFTEPMTYDNENDIIIYEDITYTRED